MLLPILGIALIGAGFSSGRKKLLGISLACLMISGLLFLAACGGGNSRRRWRRYWGHSRRNLYDLDLGIGWSRLERDQSYINRAIGIEFSEGLGLVVL